VPAKLTSNAGDPRFAWLALALSGASFIASALSAHAIGLLTATGLTAADAVLVGSLFGPMQVAGRVVEFTMGRRLAAQAVGTVAFALLALALVFLSQVKGALVTALAFALFYGFSNGVMTIVRGTVPAEIFGRHAFGTLLGRLARPQLIARAVAPVALAACFAFDPARTITPYVLVLLGAAAFVAYRKALRSR
jgi:Na+-translocating ferredoxin:NAD+ oxidoreductase RnfD subunit